MSKTRSWSLAPSSLGGGQAGVSSSGGEKPLHSLHSEIWPVLQSMQWLSDQQVLGREMAGLNWCVGLVSLILSTLEAN